MTTTEETAVATGDGVQTVEPRTADGQLTRAQGEVSIMLVDPTRDGPESRIARWDFSADEAAQSWKKTFVGEGLQFQLPWPSEAPPVGKLRLYARLVTPQAVAPSPLRGRRRRPPLRPAAARTTTGRRR